MLPRFAPQQVYNHVLDICLILTLEKIRKQRFSVAPHNFFDQHIYTRVDFRTALKFG